MQLTKTQVGMMKVFASRLTKKFSIREVALLMEKPYPLVHRSTKALVESGLLSKDERGLLRLNCKERNPAIFYVEALRTEEFLKKNGTMALFAKDVLDKIGLDFFVLLVFGSSASGKQNPSDVDILMITSAGKTDVDFAEMLLERTASNYTGVEFDCNVVSAESAREMLAKRDEPNVMNETLDNHIILFGSESYYRWLKNVG